MQHAFSSHKEETSMQTKNRLAYSNSHCNKRVQSAYAGTNARHKKTKHTYRNMARRSICPGEQLFHTLPDKVCSKRRAEVCSTDFIRKAKPQHNTSAWAQTCNLYMRHWITCTMLSMCKYYDSNKLNMSFPVKQHRNKIVICTTIKIAACNHSRKQIQCDFLFSAKVAFHTSNIKQCNAVKLSTKQTISGRYTQPR